MQMFFVTIMADSLSMYITYKAVKVKSASKPTFSVLCHDGVKTDTNKTKHSCYITGPLFCYWAHNSKVNEIKWPSNVFSFL